MRARAESRNTRNETMFSLYFAAYNSMRPSVAPGFSGGEHAAGEVPVAAVADDEDDRRPFDLFGHLQGGPASAACGDTAEDALLAGQPAGGPLSVGLGDLRAGQTLWSHTIATAPARRDRKPM